MHSKRSRSFSAVPPINAGFQKAFPSKVSFRSAKKHLSLDIRNFPELLWKKKCSKEKLLFTCSLLVYRSFSDQSFIISKTFHWWPNCGQIRIRFSDEPLWKIFLILKFIVRYLQGAFEVHHLNRKPWKFEFKKNWKIEHILSTFQLSRLLITISHHKTFAGVKNLVVKQPPNIVAT